MSTRLMLILFGALAPAMAAAHEDGSLPSPSAELLARPARSAALPSMHPAVILRDASGAPVLQSNGPASARRTCDGCHDVSWIEAHDLHADAGTRLGQVESRPSCFVCHLDPSAAHAPAATSPLWADTARLAASGLASPEGDHWTWHKPAFASDGSVPAVQLGVGRASDRACGRCHGLVDHGNEPIALGFDASLRMTNSQGIVFAGQRISDSAINLAGKEMLVRPWDVHAERMVSCANCHFPPNHPAYAWSPEAPEHLQFEARRSPLTDFLRQPDHRLARGSGHAGQPASMRGCEGCHDASKSHGWLPRAERHVAVLSCESCHIPAAYGPARQEVDWTVLTRERQPRVVYRGLGADGFVTGFRPVLLPRGQHGRDDRLVPQNLVTAWFWTGMTAQGRQRVALATVEQALFAGDRHRAELVRALDRNGDGVLDDGELLLDSEARHHQVRELLVAAGVVEPEIQGAVEAHPLHHGISPGRFATRDCSTCHDPRSRLSEPFPLSAAVPFAAMLERPSQDLGTVVRDPSRGLLLVPDTSRLHVFGHTRSGLVDGLGMGALASALVLALGHGLLRLRSRRRHQQDEGSP